MRTDPTGTVGIRRQVHGRLENPVAAARLAIPEVAVIPLSLAFAILIPVAIAVPLGLMAVSWLLHRNHPGLKSKEEPYECGIRRVVGDADGRFSVRFYLVAMLFLVFDLEVALLYPWAVKASQGGWSAFWILIAFLAILESGYLYLLGRRALDWGRRAPSSR
jgi:NADH-quinone oxidoreductase subunit A